MRDTRDKNLARLAQTALKELGFYAGELDGSWGPKSEAALRNYEVSLYPAGVILRGDGTWPWFATIEGEDIVVRGARATCFGGSNDPQDSGNTASGIKTKGNPGLMACALPMDYQGPHEPTRRALSGSPIPMVPWNTLVRVTSGAGTLTVPVIDLGPAKSTGASLDLTIAAAKFFKPSATATSFEIICDYRILGAAKYAV